MGIRGEVFSARLNTDKRTYFFNVKENRKGDLFLNLVESRKQGDESFDRHEIMVYREDLNEFVRNLERAVSAMRGPRSGSSGAGFSKDRTAR
ncbi:MAG TPA: DUF3276 family protein [Spirochaetia bacterium]|nr:DUF3276 family protein [Spirochaetia bacterium]